MLKPEHRVAILLHEGVRGESGKTGLAYLRYGAAQIVTIIDYQSAGQSLAELTGIDRDIAIAPDLKTALAYRPDVLLIGLAPSGGILPEWMRQEVELALVAGLSVVNGLHQPLEPLLSRLGDRALELGQWIWDIRQEPSGLGIGGAKAAACSCARILAVGTDMAVGKMSASLELQRAARHQGLNARFLATGQAGIMIAGEGIPLDAIRVDYAAGAVEQLVLKYAQNADLLFIEGQGSLLHPGSTATLPLLRGAQPTGLVLVHRATQTHIRNFPDISIPPLPQVVQLYEMTASAGGAFPPAPVKAIALNTAGLDETAAQIAIAQAEAETGLPCDDVVRFGADGLLAAMLSFEC
ncbi:MAG: DUF1611 domain-containing protein [Chloroflexaceae bacterium]|nr:DUF1611 domain-containing protein [Chloroflexaceae bacterium]